MNKSFYLLIVFISFGQFALGQWNSLTNLSTLQISDAAFVTADLGYVAGSNGEIHKTIDGGANWTPQNSGISQNFFSIHFENDTIGYACASNGLGYIVRTVDGGQNWISQSIASTSYLTDLFFVNDSTGYCVGYGGIILKTINYGVNWTNQTSGSSQNLRSVYFVNEDTGFVAAFHNEILKTTDGGTTWTSHSSGTTAGIVAMHFANDSTGFASGSSGTVIKTTDAGLTWTAMNANTNEYLQDVHFISPAIGYAAGGHGVITATSDGGNTWVPQTVGSFSGAYAWYGITFQDGCGYAVGYQGNVAKTCCPYSVGINSQTSCESYTWIDGNTYYSDNNSATYTFAGSTASGCDSIVTLDLTINNVTDLTTTVNGASINANSSLATYQWLDCDNGFAQITGENNQLFTALTNGNYAVELTENGCVDTSSCVPVCVPAYGNDSQTACDSLTWIDGITYYNNNNSANYTFVGAAANGCDSIVTIDLTINTISALSASVSGAIITSNNAFATYQWLDCDNGFTAVAGENNQTFTTNSNGDYAVELTENGCIDTSACVTVCNVNDITTTLSGASIIANNDSATYQWLDCDNGYAILSGETDYFFTSSGGGNYAVELTENGCVDTSACASISTVGFETEDSSLLLELFPNPTNGLITIYPGFGEEYTCYLIDGVGRIIIEFNQFKIGQIQMDLSNLANGNYSLIIQSEDLFITQKILLVK